MMVVVFTTFVFGGSTPSLLSSCNVAMGVPPVAEEVKPAEGTVFKTAEDLLVDPEVAKAGARNYKTLSA